MNQADLIALASTGASIEISARKMSQLNRLGLASACRPKGGKLILRDAESMSQSDRLGVANSNPGNVTFIF